MCSGINSLSEEKLNEYIHSNLTIIAMWNNKKCRNCDLELFTLWKMPYSYVEYSNVIIAATNVGVNRTFDELYQIKEDVERPQYRLFVHGVSSPYVNRENLPTYEWIKGVTGYTPRKEYIFPLTDHNYGHLKTKYSDRNVLILFCKPSNPDCLNLMSGYLTDAVLFRVSLRRFPYLIEHSQFPLRLRRLFSLPPSLQHSFRVFLSFLPLPRSGRRVRGR